MASWPSTDFLSTLLSSTDPSIFSRFTSRSVAASQQIQVEGRPVGPFRPEPQKQRALQHEAVAAIGDREPVEKTLKTVARQQGLLVVPGFPGEMEQARGDGGGKVLLAAHAMASR